MRKLAARATPESFGIFVKEAPAVTDYLSVSMYRRRLPHVYCTDRAVFLTWRLYGTLPAIRRFPDNPAESGRAFAALDRLLDLRGSGPVHLGLPTIASLVVDAIIFNARTLGHYELHAFAVMPNHVHLLVTPHVPLPKLTQSLKGITARRANEILGTTGAPFWQQESFDRTVRNSIEFERIQRYIHENPVRAGLSKSSSEFGWSSAFRPSVSQ